MPSIRVPYFRALTGSNFSVNRYKNQPLLTIGLLGENGSLSKVQSYIDTGSQWCLFDKQYAKHLGINNYRTTNELVHIVGVGGKTPQNIAYFHEITLVIFKNNKDMDTENAYKIKTKIGFLEKEICMAGVLGVYGFLDHFAFVANIPKGYFELNPQFDD